MKLETINPGDFKSYAGTENPCITLHINGAITFNIRAARLLGKDGEILFQIAQNPQTKGLYMATVSDKKEPHFRARIDNKGYGKVSCKGLVTHLIKEYALAVGPGRKTHVRLEIESVPVLTDSGGWYFVATK